MVKNSMRPVHPGELLLEEFMTPSDPPINANILAKALEVPANRITGDYKKIAWHYGKCSGSSSDTFQHHN